MVGSCSAILFTLFVMLMPSETQGAVESECKASTMLQVNRDKSQVTAKEERDDVEHMAEQADEVTEEDTEEDTVKDGGSTAEENTEGKGDGYPRLRPRHHARGPQCNCSCRTPSLVSKLCMAFGDPHWIGFDQHKLTRIDNIVRKKDEIVYAVKSPTVLIQVKAEGAFGRTQGIAVGGSFLGGHVLKMIRYKKQERHDFPLMVTWDGKKIIPEQGDYFETLVADGPVECAHLNKAVPAPADTKKLGWSKQIVKRFADEGQIRCRLPNNLVIYVARRDWLSIIIKMTKAPGGQDGLCGNFDDIDKDKMVDVEERMGKSFAVPWKESLFAVKPSLLEMTNYGEDSTVAAGDEVEADDLDNSVANHCTNTKEGLSFKEKVKEKCSKIKNVVFNTACVEDCCTTGDLGFQMDEEEEEVLFSMASHNA